MLSHCRQAVTKENIGAARRCWEKALGLDPTSASLNAMLGLLHCLDARFGSWDDRDIAIGKAEAYAGRALEIDPGNADAYTTSSLILLLQGRYDEAVADARKATPLAPGSADTAELASHVLAPSGYPDEAVVLSEKAISLSPNHPAVYLGTLGNAYRLSGRTEQAIAAFKAYHARSPGFGLTDIVIAYQQTGRSEDAQRTAEQLMVARPNSTIAAWLRTQLSRTRYGTSRSRHRGTSRRRASDGLVTAPTTSVIGGTNRTSSDVRHWSRTGTKRTWQGKPISVAIDRDESEPQKF